MNERNELQSYVIKREFIKNIKIKTLNLKAPEFQFLQKGFQVQKDFQLQIEFNYFHPDDDHLIEAFQKDIYFAYNVTTLIQSLFLDLTTEQIIAGEVPEKVIMLTPEFLRWDFPAIQKMVEAYLEDSAWKSYFLPFTMFSDFVDF